MLRFPTFLFACLGLAGCSPQQGDPIGAGIGAPSASFVGSAPSTTAPSNTVAPVAIVESEPVAHVRRTARTPVPPKRPDLALADDAAAPVARTSAPSQAVAQNEPVAQTQPQTLAVAQSPAIAQPVTQHQPIAQSQPIAQTQPVAPSRSIAAGRNTAPAQPIAQSQTVGVAGAAEPETATGIFSFARAFAAPTEPAAIPAVARTEAAPERLPLVRAAFTPGAGTRFDPSRRAYGYVPTEREDEGLEMTPRPGFEKTTPRVSEPGQRYFAAYSNTEVSCFPQRLREALNTIAKHYGQEVEVTSGMRHNGRRGSYHRRCMAADIRVPGVGPGALAAFAKTIDGVNGVGTYRHNSVTHIDVRDYQMSWRH